MNETASTAAQVLITIIPIVGIVAGATIAFFSLLWSHRRKLRLIEQGMTPRGEFDLEAFSLLTGLVASTVGLALTIFYLVIAGISYLLLGGIIPLSAGLGLLIYYGIRRGQLTE